MKLGIVLSLIFILFLSLLGFFAYRGVADPSTNATSPTKLSKRQLPSDLPALFMPNTPTGNAARTYSKILNLYHDHRDKFNDDEPPIEVTDQLSNLLITAMQQERVQDGFLDEHIPVQIGATPDFYDALELLPALALMRAQEAYQDGRESHAMTIARAVWALGQRAFQNNVRLYNRLQGLTIMLDAGDKLLPWSLEMGGSDSDSIKQWMKAVNEIGEIWKAKYELLSSLRPHKGDLLMIARKDEDISFRVAATLKLGLAKFNPGGRGNKRVIDATIGQAKNHSHSMIVQSGIAAAGLTKEQMRKLH